MRLRKAIPALVLLLVLLGGTALAAGTYHIERYVIAGGGGQASGGVYALRSTVGQPVAGSVSSGGYALCAGYWCGGSGAVVSQYVVHLPLVVRDW
jgi:hypothetical protein